MNKREIKRFLASNLKDCNNKFNNRAYNFEEFYKEIKREQQSGCVSYELSSHYTKSGKPVVFYFN